MMLIIPARYPEPQNLFRKLPTTDQTAFQPSTSQPLGTVAHTTTVRQVISTVGVCFSLDESWEMQTKVLTYLA